MRILTNTLVLAPATGIDTYAVQMARALAARGHELHVLAQRDGALRPDWESFAAGVTVCGDFLHRPFNPRALGRPWALAPWARALARAVASGRRAGADVVFANDAQALPWARLCAARDAAVVCHLHNQLGGQPLGLQRRVLGRRVDRFVTPSAFLRDDWVASGLPAERVTVVPQALEVSAFPPATPERRAAARRPFGIGPDAFVVAFVGRVVADKGIDTLVEAWRRLDLPPGEGRLVVVGEVWPPEYADHLARTAPLDRCTFVPPRLDVVSVLHAADVVALPSLWPEAGPRVVLEAMATGCPVVTSRAGAAPELLPDRLARLMVAPGDAAGLAERLRGLRHWRRTEPSLGDAGRAHVTANHDMRVAAERLESVLAGARSGP